MGPNNHGLVRRWNLSISKHQQGIKAPVTHLELEEELMMAQMGKWPPSEDASVVLCGPQGLTWIRNADPECRTKLRSALQSGLQPIGWLTVSEEGELSVFVMEKYKGAKPIEEALSALARTIDEAMAVTNEEEKRKAA